MTERIVWALWVDSAEACHGWNEPTPNKGRAGAQVRTVGYLIAEDAESITVAVAVDDLNGHALNPVTIWKPAIVEWGDVQWV